jgi:hypothetical protein
VAAGPAPALAATPPLDSTGLDIAGLIRRVDSALEGDGQLL